MAIEQGICKNCGSLLMVSTADEMCECVFCDCVFPGAEAIEIFNNPDGVEFPNLPQPKREKAAVRHVATPVFENVVEQAVKVDRAQTKETKVEKLFEISPDDIKAPSKVKKIVGISTAAAVAVVLAISVPLCVLRYSHRKAIRKDLSVVIESSKMEVSLETEDGYAKNYKLDGQTNKELTLVATKEVDNSQVLLAFESFCQIRGEEYGYSSDDGAHYYDGVVLKVYAPNGRFTLEGNKDGVKEDQIEFFVPEEESEADEKD